MRPPLALLYAAAFLVLSIVPSARATLIIDPGQCGNDPARCVATNNIVTATAFTPIEIQPAVTNPGYVRFQQAFNSWNTSGAWTLATSDLSATAILDLILYHAYVGDCGITCGGAEITITYNNGGNPPFPISGCPSIPGQEQCQPGSFPEGAAIWSQSVFTTAKRDPSLPGNPYLDNAPGTQNASIGPPAYPFQYNTSFFYDKPGRDANASWLGDAWISSINDTTHILTIYDGVEWGFNVVPEPNSLLLIATALVGFGLIRRRRKEDANLSRQYRKD